MTEYPNALKTFTQQVDNVSDAEAADVNEIYDEVEAIETELGTNPKNNFSSVKEAVFQKGSNADRVAGTWVEGQHFYETDTNKTYKCTVGGTPGTWEELAGVASPGAHKDSHDPISGSDAVDTAVPEDLAVGNTQAIGTNDSLARSNHRHGVTAGIPSNIGTGNSAGSGTDFCREDHVHNHPSGLGLELHHKVNPNILIEAVFQDSNNPPDQGTVGYSPTVDFGASADTVGYFNFRVPPDCDVSQDIILQMDFCMSTAEAGKNVSMNLEYDVIVDGGDCTPVSHSGIKEDEIAITSSSAEVRQAFTGTNLKIDNADISSTGLLVACKIWRDVDGATSNHGGVFQLLTLRMNYTLAV